MKDISTIEIEKAQAAVEREAYIQWREDNPELAAARDRKLAAKLKQYRKHVGELHKEYLRITRETKNAVN